MKMGRMLEKLSAELFSHFVLGPINLADRFLGERIWDPLDRTTQTLSRLAGRILRSSGSHGGEHPLSAAMELVDRCEGWVGVRGGWEVVDDRTVLRKVEECPFLPKLEGRPTFCKRLGLTMGEEALASAFPDQKIRFDILSTLSAGDACCTYRLHLEADG